MLGACRLLIRFDLRVGTLTSFLMARGRKRSTTTDSTDPNGVRPARSRQLPTRYRRRAAAGQDGEYIDPTPEDDSSDDSDDNPGALVDTRHPLNTTSDTLAMAITDPLVTNHSSKGGNVAHNIHHFFRKETDEMVCLLCE